MGGGEGQSSNSGRTRKRGGSSSSRIADRGGGGGGGQGETVIIDHGVSRTPCGYCKSPLGNTSISHGLWALSITVDDYQELLDRGWRRSGSYLYKPEMEITCCPSYTIRLKADKFAPSKDQLRVLKKMNSFLDGRFDLKSSHQLKDDAKSLKELSSQDSQSSSRATGSNSQTEVNKDMHKEDNYISFLSSKIDDAVSACIERGGFPLTVQLPKALVKKVTPQSKKKLVKILSEDLLYSCSISFQIAAVLRQSEATLTSDANQNGGNSEFSPSIVAEKLVCSMDRIGVLSGISVKACNGHLNFYSSSSSQIDSSENSATGNISNQSFKENVGDIKHRGSDVPHKKHRLEIQMKRSSFDPEEYALYRRYQIEVHNDKPEKVTEASYRRFLVDSPLIFCPPRSSSREVPSCGFGSFHQQYLIDGKLVAVGVVDILPKCLSSKYLFWDPEFSFLSLGKYSSLKEIDWVKEPQVQCQSLQYYYLGYYIHSCSKMRYKAAYCPSELLCPLRYQWVPFDIARPLLDKKPYVVLSDFANTQKEASCPRDLSLAMEPCEGPEQGVPSGSHSDEDEMQIDSDSEGYTSLVGEVSLGDIGNILIDLNGCRVRFKDLEQVIVRFDRKNMKMLELQLQKYFGAVGSGLAGHMIYSLR